MVVVHAGHVQQILHTLFVEATLAAIKNRQGEDETEGKYTEGPKKKKKKEEQRPVFLKEIGKFNH